MTQQDINKYGNTSVTTEEVNEGNKEKEQSLSTTVTATIDGKQETITVAFTKYSMSQPKDKIIRLGDKERRMEVIFHFAKPEIFWNEEIELLTEMRISLQKIQRTFSFFAIQQIPIGEFSLIKPSIK